MEEVTKPKDYEVNKGTYGHLIKQYINIVVLSGFYKKDDTDIINERLTELINGLITKETIPQDGFDYIISEGNKEIEISYPVEDRTPENIKKYKSQLNILRKPRIN